MAQENNSDETKANVEERVAGARARALELACRVRAALAKDQQRLLDEVLRLDDPGKILATSFCLLKEDLVTLVELECRLETLLPSVTRLTKLMAQFIRWDQAEHDAQRKRQRVDNQQ